MGFACFSAFLCEKVIKTRRFSHLQLRGCSGLRPGARGGEELKSLFDQNLDAQMFHVKQKENANLGLSSPAIDFHFLPISGFWAAQSGASVQERFFGVALENVTAQIDVRGEIADASLDVGAVHDHGFSGLVGWPRNSPRPAPAPAPSATCARRCFRRLRSPERRSAPGRRWRRR